MSLVYPNETGEGEEALPPNGSFCIKSPREIRCSGAMSSADKTMAAIQATSNASIATIKLDTKRFDSKVIRNPYAQRRAPLPLFQNPLYTNDNSANDPYQIDASSEGEGDQTIGASVVRATDCSMAEAPVSTMQGRTAASLSTGHPVETTKRTDLPPWERLPSRAVSFSSAEIITVSELYESQRKEEPKLQPNSDPSVGAWRRSVRVMGVLTHKVIHSDASVSLILKDPLPSQQHVNQDLVARGKHVNSGSSILRPYVTHTRATATLERPRIDDSTLKQTPRDSVHIPRPPRSPVTIAASLVTAKQLPCQPATTLSRKVLQQSMPGLGRTATPGMRSIIRPQPLKSRSTQRLSTSAITTASAITDRSRNTQQPLSGHKRSLNGIPSKSIPRDPLRSLATMVAHQEQIKSVWVVVPPGFESVNQIIVGDLVTVIGEVYWTSFGISTDDRTADQVTGAIQQTMQSLKSMLISERHAEGETSESMTTRMNGEDIFSSPVKRASPPLSLVVDRVMHVQARILQESNGTNVALFAQALNARRQLLANRNRISSDISDR